MGREEGNELWAREGGQEGAPRSQPPRQLPQCPPQSAPLTCQLRSTPSPGVSFGKASSGEGLLLSGEPVCLGEDACLVSAAPGAEAIASPGAAAC